MKRSLLSALISIMVSCAVLAQTTATILPTNVSCFGMCDGMLTVVVQPQGNYRYLWNNGATTQTIDSLCSGSYLCIISDTQGTVLDSVAIFLQQPAAINITGTIINGSCAIGGSICINVSGGTGPYTQAWSNGFSLPFGYCPTGLSSGNYTVTITDTSGCTGIQSFNVIGRSYTYGQINTSACQSCNGSIIVNGTPGANYMWSNGDTVSSPQNLCVGDYYVTITDTSGVCIDSFTILKDILTLNITYSNPNCTSSSNIACAITATSAFPITYLWSNADTTFCLQNVSAGDYNVTVTDSRGCTISDSVTIISMLNVTTAGVNSTCGNSDGFASVSVLSGSGVYSYQWSPVSGTDSFLTGLPPGIYVVVVYDSLLNCSKADSIYLIGMCTQTICVGDSFFAGGAFQTATGIYADTFINSNGGDSIIVTDLTVSSISISAVQDSLCLGDSLFVGGSFQFTSGIYFDTLNTFSGCDSIIATTLIVDSCNIIISDVWPGDANSDGIANNMDVLSIGIGYGISGFIRPNATLNWVGQPSPDWLLALASGANLKHVDCNGDSTINSFDTLAITRNYGLTHLKTSSGGGPGDPEIYFVIPNDTVLAGEQIEIPIFIGTDTLPVSAIYGVGFTVGYSDYIVEDNVMLFVPDTSFLGIPGFNVLSYSINLDTLTQIDIALTRTDHVDTSGWGQIGRLRFRVAENLTPKNSLIAALNLSFSAVKANDAQEVDVPIEINSSVVYVKQEDVGIFGKEEPGFKVNIYPNPFKDNLTVELEGKMPDARLEIYDLFGKRLYQFEIPATKKLFINNITLSKGMYLYRITTNGEPIGNGKIVRY